MNLKMRVEASIQHSEHFKGDYWKEAVVARTFGGHHFLDDSVLES